MDNLFDDPYLCYYPKERKPLDTFMTDFVEFMDDEWKKRVEMVATLQDLKSKVRLNRIQCTHIIDIYSTLEVLTSHPENYLDTVDEDDLDDELEDVSREPVTFPINRDSTALRRKEELSEGDIKLDLEICISDLRALFLELNKIMCHGEILVRGCICEDWIGGAVTQTTTIPKNDWSIETPYFHHLQQLEWILNAIGRGIKEFWTIENGDVSNLEKHFTVFSIVPPNPEVDVGQDRQMLLDDLLEYLSMAPSSEDEKGSEERLQLARFLVWRLQDRSLLHSNDSSDVATCDDARIGRNKMTLIGVLGRGGCSLAVYSKRWLGIMVAVKELEIEALFAKEVEFAGLQHPNIVQVLDHWIGERPNIVMELMDMDLYSFMEKHFKRTPPPLSWAFNVMHQLAEALKYLEDNKVIHRDLKCLNVLVRRCPCEYDGCIIVKLADFGGSKFSPTGRAELKTVVGTPGWMAPEVYEDGRVSDLGYTTAADVFSFAITCSEVLTGKLPFTSRGLQLKKDIREGLRPALPPSCPLLLHAYLERCWALNPEERPQSFSEVCNFLLVFKEKMLRDGPTINDDDLKVLLTHFGLKWCIARNVKWGKYSTGPGSTVYIRIMSAIHNGTFELLQNLTGSEVLEAADFFGNWSGDQHSYEKATDILQRWEESPSSNAEMTWRLGYCYELGLGVSKDISKAVSLYQKVCSQYPEVEYASAWVELGRCYAMGRGVEKPDLQLASTCWDTAGKCEDKLPKSILEQLKILSSAYCGSSRILAKQRLCELTATKSGQNLFKAFGRQPDEFESTGHKETIWEIAQQIAGMCGLIPASVAGLITSYNEEGKIRLYATCGRLLLLSILVSCMSLPVFRPIFSFQELKDFMFKVTSYLIALSAVLILRLWSFSKEQEDEELRSPKEAGVNRVSVRST